MIKYISQSILFTYWADSNNSVFSFQSLCRCTDNSRRKTSIQSVQQIQRTSNASHSSCWKKIKRFTKKGKVFSVFLVFLSQAGFGLYCLMWNDIHGSFQHVVLRFSVKKQKNWDSFTLGKSSKLDMKVKPTFEVFGNQPKIEFYDNEKNCNFQLNFMLIFPLLCKVSVMGIQKLFLQYLIFFNVMYASKHDSWCESNPFSCCNAVSQTLQSHQWQHVLNNLSQMKC